MDFRVAEEALTLREVLVDTTVEQPLESDMILPDYCPDVARLLKCEMVPGITSHQIGMEKLVVDGTAQIRVIYLTEEGTVHCAQSVLPFSKTIEVKDAGEDPLVHLDGLLRGDEALQPPVALHAVAADQAVALHLLEHARHRGAADAEHALHVALIHRPFFALDQYVVQRVALDARQPQRLHLRVDALAQLVEQQADPAAKVLFHAVSSLPRPMGDIVRKQTIF